MFAKWFSYWMHLSPRTRTLIIIAMLVGVMWLDAHTGAEIPLTIFYLPLIALVCWQISMTAAIALAWVCCCLWILGDLLLRGSVSQQIEHYWIAAVHFAFFLVVVTTLTRLRLALDREQTRSRIDALTGLMNNVAFQEAAEIELARARRSGKPLTLAFIDCDNFKAVNDSYGHLAGDQLLRCLGGGLRRFLRPTDTVARLGGDEFAVLLSDCDEAKARLVLNRVRNDLALLLKTSPWQTTLSIGAAVFLTPASDLETMMRAADHLMYTIKRAAKDGLAIAVHRGDGRPDAEFSQSADSGAEAAAIGGRC